METTTITTFEGIPNLEEILKDKPEWLDEAIADVEAAHLRGKSTIALAVERSRGKGPRFISDGRTIRYTRRDIFEYLASKRVRLA